MKRTLKIMSMVMLVVCVLSTSAYALTPADITASATTADTGIQNLAGKIIGVISTVGIVLSVIILSILGIKYMMGSAEEKAEYKKSLMPYIIGSVLVFGASSIATIVYNFSSSAIVV